jgi:anti-sigma regulatory factor (Ser/Thr protein kinase)/ActR/RegA family two-component response regulator
MILDSVYPQVKSPEPLLKGWPNSDLEMNAAPELASTPAPAKIVLIIGSDPEVESTLSRLLGSEGWSIDWASENDAAFVKARSQSFDLIVTGRHTSGREDVEFLRKLRNIRPHTRLIILTDDSTPADVLASMREHAFAYLSNTFSIEALEELVRQALDSPTWDDGIEVASATPEWIHLSVRCDLETADRLLLFMCEISDLPDDEKNDVSTAFREMLLNAMEHGGKFDPSQYVKISYIRTSHMVLCRIKDPGTGFSLEEIQHAAFANPPEDPTRHISTRDEKGMRPGGFGVLLAKNLVDDLIYGEKGNEVLLIKYLTPPERPKVSD